MSEVREHIVVTVLRVCLGVFLIFVGGEKFFRLGDFYEDILNYELVGGSFAEMLAFILPTVEVVLSSAWVRGLEISCGCSPWSADEKTNYPLGIGINVFLLALTIVLLFRELKGEPLKKLKG